MLRNCELWKSFRERRHRGRSRLLEKGIVEKPELNLEKGPFGTYLAPGQVLASESIFQELTVAGVVAKALIDSGATTSCCSQYWYKRHRPR